MTSFADNRIMHRRTRIKICGVTSIEIAQTAADAGADAIGLVFVPDSPRYVLPGPAQRIARSLPPLMSAIGVFVNPSDPDLQNWRGQWVQLHGQEEESQTARVAQTRRIIKGVRFDQNLIRKWDRSPHVSALLIDGSAGGMGEAFDHRALSDLLSEIKTPVILAGGLTMQNVGDAIRMLRPFGVDVSSGVESSRGVKDAGMIREFCGAVRDADRSPVVA
jgi:phosphoribosylanthranilate isomerase